MVPEWLRVEIVTGLQMLFALRLVGTPPEDAIVGTAEVWLLAVESSGVVWEESLDRVRVQRSFRTLLRICDRWPAPKLFLEHLGNRDPPLALPRATAPPENRERYRAMLAEWKATLAKSREVFDSRKRK